MGAANLDSDFAFLGRVNHYSRDVQRLLGLPCYRCLALDWLHAHFETDLRTGLGFAKARRSSGNKEKQSALSQLGAKQPKYAGHAVP